MFCCVAVGSGEFHQKIPVANPEKIATVTQLLQGNAWLLPLISRLPETDMPSLSRDPDAAAYTPGR
jgi:hypothetical protein